MVDKRLLNIQKMIQRQHAAGTASEEALVEINNLVRESEIKETQNIQISIMDGARVRAIRQREKLSQSELAHMMNLSANSIQKWERNATHPQGAALRLLEVIERTGVSFLIG